MSAVNASAVLAAAGGGYEISRSIRLRSSSSARLTRTFSSSVSRTKWSFSSWIKRGQLGLSPILGAASSPNDRTDIGFDSNNRLEFISYSSSTIVARLTTTRVFRDPAAWYHIFISVDTNNSAGDRLQIWINGIRETVFSFSSGPTANLSMFISGAYSHYINTNQSQSVFGSMHMAETHFVASQQLTPASFGQNDPITGVWTPIKYTGTYGANSWYLNFSEVNSSSATTMGKDYSGNVNDWTPYGVLTTGGLSLMDSSYDVPVSWADGANGRGNYCTLNPLNPYVGNDQTSYSYANLSAYGNMGLNTAVGTMAIESKCFFEGLVTDTNNARRIGILNVDTGAVYYYDGQSGEVVLNGTATAYGSQYFVGSMVNVAVDPINRTLEFFFNGTSQGVVTSAFPAGNYVPYFYMGQFVGWRVNFGQIDYYMTAPTGFVGISTLKMTEPTIKNPNKYFDATKFNGVTGGTQSVTNSGFQPDLIWLKSRTNGTDNFLFDSVRGVANYLISNSSAAETNLSSFVTGVNSSGWNMGSSGYGSGDAVIGWNWKESVSAGFDIVTYTGTGSNTTIAHSLGVAPKMMIVRLRSGVQDWIVWHQGIAATEFMLLNGSGAKSTATTFWNSTAPSSSVFSIGSSGATNTASGSYVAYLFSEVSGYSKFGTAVGNSNADGPFVYCGFKPKFILWKKSSSGTSQAWTMWDASRNGYNTQNNTLYASAAITELATEYVDILSNGFKMRTNNSYDNQSGETYIFAAFAESPFKNSIAR